MYLWIIPVLIICSASASAHLTLDNNVPSVCIDQGCLRGVVEVGEKKSFYAFYGIPYAAPPIGNLRFANPDPPIPWQGVYDATQPKAPCVLFDLQTKTKTGDEDCLHLNVYRPQRSLKGRELLPVLVFIHGGSFKMGSTHPSEHGGDYIMDTEEVILVIMQYRLNVFGFLASGDRSAEGNFGLKDQQKALRWVNRNILHFGGNPRMVTLMGHSSGAASVQYQMMNRKSNGLFQKAIMASGSALAYWAHRRNPEVLFRQYASIAGVSNAETETTENIVNNLRTRSAEDLLSFAEMIPTGGLALATVFRPVTEGKWADAFITKDPEVLWKSGAFEPRPLLTGITGFEEGAFSDLYFYEPLRTTMMQNFDTLVPQLVDVPSEAVSLFKDHYFNGVITEENSYNLLRFRESTYDYPYYKTLKYFVRNADTQRYPVDLYWFDYKTSFSTSALFNVAPSSPERGASHFDDMLHLFRFRILDPLFARSKADKQMKDFYVRYIVEYVSSGKQRINKWAEPCDSWAMKKNGFCEYLKIEGDTKSNSFKLSISDYFDMSMVKVLQQVDKITKEHNLINR